MGIVSDSSACRLLPKPLSWRNGVESAAWSHLAQVRAPASSPFICYCICGDLRIYTNSLLAIPLRSTCLCLRLATTSQQSSARICVSGLGLITSWVPHTNTLVRRLLAHSLLPFWFQTHCSHRLLVPSQCHSPVSRFLGAGTLTV
jgi:hypothetical protein